MVPAKLLVGSVVAVGSVSTAAVVAHQQGFFSLPGSQTQSSDDTTNADVQPTPQTEPSPVADEKPKQKEVKKWLTDHSNSEGWKIQIRKSGGTDAKGFEDESITENDLDGLKGYLSASEREALLKSLFSALESKTLIFEKTGNDWKHILTTADIEKWVNKTSGSKATLKLSEANTPKQLTDTQIDLNKLLEDLFKEKSAFEGITLETPATTKNILFEKTDNGWKHSKKEIEEWLKLGSGGNSEFSIEVQKGNDGKKELDKADEEDLIGLLTYLKTTTKEELSKFTKDPTPTPLTFKKETNWDVVHSSTTIDNWVKNNGGDKTTIQFYEGAQTGTPTEGEWKTLFDLVKNKKESFSSSAETKIIFEKVDNGWKHIKTAIEDWLKSSEGGSGKLTVQIKKDDSNKPKWDDPSFKDEDWIGLLKHIKGKKDTYVPKPQDGQSGVADKTITLQKKSDSADDKWEEASS